MAITLKNRKTGKTWSSGEDSNRSTQASAENSGDVWASPSGKTTLRQISKTKYTGAPSPYIPAQKRQEKQNAEQGFFSRAGKTVSGGLKGSLAGNMDAMGVAYQAGQGGRTQRNTAALKDAQWAVARAKYAYDQEKSPSSAAELDNALKQMKAYATVLGDGAYDQALKAAYDASGRIGTADLNKLYESLGKVNVNTSTGVQQKATKASRDLALQVQQSGSRDIEAAKEGVGTFGQMVIDAGASMAQMGGDLAVNALLGTPGSMMPFATRAFGGATMQAREGGGDLKQQVAYGAVQAGKEVLTEKMFNMALPFAKAYGGGALDDVTQRAIQTAVDKLGKTAAGKRALNAALQLTASGVGEGLEELIGDWMEWQMPRIYGGDVDAAGETLANSLYDFVVGGMAGVAGSVISPDTYSYGRYAADVRQNTAPEMDSKAAQAVDAVTRGESITGNQAAAIAKNPVAVETLEANTGVKLNTQQPISQLKRDIAALASRDTTQTQPHGTTATPVAQRRAQKHTGGFLEAGQKAYQEMSRTAEDVPTLYAGFSSVYNAGLNGIEASKAKGAYAAMLTPEQRYAAYNAGLEDAAAQVARENAEVKSVTTTAGAGLADNAYSRAVIAKSKRTAATLNAMGKKLGVRIEFVDSVMGGQANGQYIRDKNLIQIAVDSNKPYLNVAAHEVTHRMQDLSPAEYRKFRQAAMEHHMREKGIDEMAEVVEWYREKAENSSVTLTRDEVMDEIAADFAGNMMENPDLFREFSQSNRTAAKKLLDSLKEFIAKVKSIFTGKARDVAAQEAYGKDFAELEAVAQKWREAFDAAEQQAERATVSATVRSGDTVQYDDAVYSLRVTDKDTLDFLNKQKTITTYKTMQLVDGKLYPPMAARVDGKYEDASELGAWEMSVERPDLVKDGKFKLDKGKGQGSLTAAYNPYMHSSTLVINDQFSGAYTRDNLVTVECEVPVSEMTSGYHADGAKDSVGWHSWHTGTVAGQVRRATGVERKVFLSRWIKPVRILPDAEVANMYKELLGDTGIEVPDNVVTPGLLAELKKAGVPIKESGRVKTAAGEGDVRMMLKDYSYDALVRKPDMTLAVVEDADGLTRKEVVDKALAEAKKYGGVNQNGNVYVHVNDTDADVIISAKALRHGLDRRFTVNAPATLKVGEILQNAVRVNELVPKLDTVDATYVLMGAAKNKNNESYIVQFVVNRASNEVMSVDVLYAINAKKEPAALLPKFTDGSAPLTGSSISIADLLTYVNRYFPDVLPESVLRHFGHRERPAGKLGEGALFSLKAYSDAEKKGHVKSAKEFFGRTYSWNETGYITTDGTKLDFSGRHDGGPGGYRAVDHRDIRDALGLDYGGDDYSGAMVQFMGEGNIRISPESGGINLSVMPTKAQLDTLADFISKNRGEVILDLDDTNGNTVSSTEYPRGTHSSKVINDIKAYFETGTMPQVSELGKFRYQLRSTADIEQEMRDLKRERTALASRNRALKQRVQDLKGEMRISKDPSVVLRDVKRLGLDTIRRYDSDVKYADIQTDMEALGKAVMKRDVSMSDLMPYAKRVAEKIVDNTAELTENGAELLEIRDYLKRQKILTTGEMYYYNEFRKQHMGTMKLNKKDGTPVDTIYAEMTEMFGEGYFPSDVYTEADKLYRIADVLDGMDAIYQNPFAGYRDAAVQEIANDIIDGMISDQVRQKKTYADRVALEKQEAVGRVREMLHKEREKRKGQIKQLRNEYSEKTQKGREKRYATEMRARIARHTGSISEKLLRPTDKKHIPEELRVVVADLLRNINLESAYSYDENGRLRKSAGGDPTKRTMQAEKLRRLYDDIIDHDGDMVVDPALTEGGGLLASLSDLGDKRIADMSVTELETVWNAIRAIENTLTSYNRTQANEKYAHISEWAEDLAAGSMSRRRRNRKLSLDMADPYTYFSAYGKAGMQIYRTLRNAQDREHVMLLDVRDSAKRFLDADVYKNRDERHTFTTGRGVELTLTTGQIMNLYNLAKRGEQAMNHLMVGGIVQPEIKRDGKLKAIDRGEQNIQLTLEDIKAITSVLTPEQIKVADGLQKLASTKLAEWGNEASMQVYGYRKFKEEHYWPIKAARDAVSATVEKDADNARSIKNMGSAKALTPNASNALDIGDVYDVFAQNASDMIKYATLLAPMEDINRLYNYRYRDSMGNLTGRNVQQVLSGVYGDSAQKYWRNLMRDVQNGMVKNASATTRAVERIVGNAKGAAVGANLRVVIQQPTAYFRAAVALDPEYMVKGVKKGVTAGNGWDKARRWAPIAGIKDTSGFDQGSRYTIAREVYGTGGGVLEWLNDKSMALAGKADAVTWSKIWNACEWQVASETNLEVGSDAYYRQVAAVFTDVIDQTQVVDGIMQRAQIMRDSDALTRQATSFMGEPLKSLNMFMRAYDAWAYENNPQKRSSALKKLKRSVAALVVTDVVNALAQSIVDGLRDDDKDKNWAERILEAFTGYSGDEENAGEVVKNVVLGGNLISNMNPIGRIPYLRDILSILQGYTVDRMDAAAADDIIRTGKTFIKGLNGDAKTTTAYNLKQVMLMCSKVFGISIGNMGRDMWSIARSIASDTGNVRLMFEMEKAIYRMDKSAGNKKRWCELLYRAQKDNDTETARLIYKEMLEHGYEETDVRQGVEAIMKAEQKVKSVDDLKNRWRAP